MERFHGTITFPRTSHRGFPTWAKEIDTKVTIIIATDEEWKKYDREISEDHTLYVYEDKVKIGDGLGYICALPFADIFWADSGEIHKNILENMFSLYQSKSIVENGVLKLGQGV